MDRSSVLARIDSVSQEMLLAELSDLQALARIHTDISEMRAWTAAQGQTQAAVALDAIGDLIEKIILNDVPSPTASMDLIVRGIAAFQTMVRDQRSYEEAGFPRELGAATVPRQASSQTSESRQSGRDEISAAVTQFQRDLSAVEHEANEQTVLEMKRTLDTIERVATPAGFGDVSVVARAAYDALGCRTGNEIPLVVRGAATWLVGWCDGNNAPGEFDALIEGLARVGETNMLSPTSENMLLADDELLREFIAEAKEHLQNADVQILEIEASPENSDAINAVFRAFHTIKGVAGFLSLDDVQALAHEAENVLDLARKGDLTLSGNYIDLIFEAVDAMKRLIQFVEQALQEAVPLQRDVTLAVLVGRLKEAASGKLPCEPGESLLVSSPGKRLGEILVESGLARRNAVAAALENQQQPEPPLLGEQLVSEIIITRAQLEEALAIQAGSGGKRLGEILVTMGAATWEDINRAIACQNQVEAAPIGELLVRAGEVTGKDVAQALRGQQARHGETHEAIKVDADRLDGLINLIGELVIAESMVTQSSELAGASQQFVRHLNQLDKITRELQQMGTALRMVPIRATFQKMSRLVRDVAKKTGKKVEFITEGDDTELDKTVIDQIGDPLVHMVRNAIDHGLEASGEDRIAAGKSETGRVTLRAKHRGGSIYIEVEDDGRGLNRDVLLAKGRERGLIREGDTPSDREIYNFLFEPGFSTAKAITDISGRGVGMDVVRRNIESLRGQIDIQSEPGKGTTFSLRLPLTLAIIDGMVVRVGRERYVVPTLSIVRSIQPEPKNIANIASRGELLVVEDAMYPLFRLHSLFDIAQAERDPFKAIVLVLENDARRVGLMVDELLGQQQIVIKPLGHGMREIDGVAGAAIMSDGTVGLIIDVGGLVRLMGGGFPESEPSAA